MPKRKFYSVDRHGSTANYDKKAKIGILSEDVMSYYRNVSSSLENGFDEDHDLKEEFLSNVYNTLRDEGIQVSQNQTVSRILEVLFSHSKPSHMQDLFCLFCGELTIVVFDRFASHVFQALIQYLPAMYDDRNDEDEAVWRKSFYENVQTLCNFMESHLRDVMTHTYGSHVLRSFMEALGGVHVKEEVVRSRVSRGQRKDNESSHQTLKTMSKTFSTTFLSSFNTLSEKIIRLCNFEDHLADQNFCPVLQTLMLILHKTSPDKYQDLVNTIIDKAKLFHHNEDAGADDVANRLPDIVQNEVGSYLVELLLSLATETQLQELYSNLFKRRIIYFAVHPIANYVLQKMLSCVKQSQMMGELLTDIKPYLEDILAVNHIGIVTKLALACRSTQTGQEEFLQALMGAFHCVEPEDRQRKVVPLLASLQTYEVFYDTSEKRSEKTDEEKTASSTPLLKNVNIHGSLILQELLQFQRTQVVASSLVNLTAPEIAGLCCDRCGSHVIDVFFTSRTVLEKNKVAMLKKLQGSFINIACNKNGSRCLENVWKTCALKQKIHIAEDLSKNQERIEGDQWGKFLYRNFALFKFSQRRKEWLDIQAVTTKKRQLIKDILEGSSRKTKKNKSKEDGTGPDVPLQNPLKSEDVQIKIKRKSKEPMEEQLDDSLKKPKALIDTEDKTVEGDTASQSEDEKKKRKRKKGKKRVVRGEKSSDTFTSSSQEVEDGHSQKVLAADKEMIGESSRKVKKVKEKGKSNLCVEKIQPSETIKSNDPHEVLKKKKKKKKSEKG
ncbi:nucleolar protein 9-like [Elysia marginata]|uniref:Nucleolar protein 9-like n=1 Tax=Elysia marginata TaxID=1093978 RepID=A0AAV4GSB0_9GAST|nr:nucleolar protein 9-like [Elysia marginata]